VELSGILSGWFLAATVLLTRRTCKKSIHWNFFLCHIQIAKLCMIPVSCFLEVLFDKIHYSRDTKLSIMVVLIGVAVCTVSDVSVNTRGLVAAVIAVWSTALQQYVSNMVIIPFCSHVCPLYMPRILQFVVLTENLNIRIYCVLLLCKMD